jgi:acetoin utilization protein AcuB
MVTRRDIGSRSDINLRKSAITTRHLSKEKLEEELYRVKVREIIPEGQQLITIYQDAYIEQAARILRDNKISGLPVVDDNSNLIGIITQTDISDAFLEILGINLPGTRISLRIEGKPEELIILGKILSTHGAEVKNIVSMEVIGEAYLMILRIIHPESRMIVDELKAAGFKVESTIVKP